jgi:hypothetical protein
LLVVCCLLPVVCCLLLVACCLLPFHLIKKYSSTKTHQYKKKCYLCSLKVLYLFSTIEVFCL